MSAALRSLCGLSVLFGLALQLAPEGGSKRILSLLCAAALLSSVLMPCTDFSFTDYAKELARMKEEEHRLLEKGEEVNERLNRLVIAQEYETYIRDRAAALELELFAVDLQFAWSVDGFWVPEAVSIQYSGPENQRDKLALVLQAELGIPREKQDWSLYDGS